MSDDELINVSRVPTVENKGRMLPREVAEKLNEVYAAFVDRYQREDQLVLSLSIIALELGVPPNEEAVIKRVQELVKLEREYRKQLIAEMANEAQKQGLY